MELPEKFMRKRNRKAVALFLGYGIIAADALLFNLALNKPFSIDGAAFVLKGLLISVPFLVLASRKNQHLIPWVLAFMFSAGVTLWWLDKGIAYQRNPDGSGVDIFGALIFLLAPFVITAACVAIAIQMDKRFASSR